MVPKTQHKSKHMNQSSSLDFPWLVEFPKKVGHNSRLPMVSINVYATETSQLSGTHSLGLILNN